MQFTLYALRIFVSDWPRALDFYTRTLGLPLVFANPDLGWAELDTGQTRLALERVDPGEPGHKGLVGRFVGLSLQVDQIDAAYRELQSRGVVFTQPPTAQAWGGLLAEFLDPDGNVLTLMG